MEEYSGYVGLDVHKDTIAVAVAYPPRLDNGDSLMVFGSARPLLQALQHATTALQGWLMADQGGSGNKGTHFVNKSMSATCLTRPG